MAPLNAALALTAPTDVDVELAVDWLTRDLDLKLLGNVGFVEQTATVGAGVGQRCLVDLVDLFRGRGLAVGLGAIVLARLAPWLARIWLGLTLGKGSGLALAGAEGRVEFTTESLVLGFQVVDSSLKGLAAGKSVPGQ